MEKEIESGEKGRKGGRENRTEKAKIQPTIQLSGMRQAIKPDLAGERKAHVGSDKTMLLAAMSCYLLLFAAICFYLLLFAAMCCY